MNKKNAWITFLPLWVFSNAGGYFLSAILRYSNLLTYEVYVVLSPLILGLLQFLLLRKLMAMNWKWLSLSFISNIVFYVFVIMSDLIASLPVTSAWYLLFEVIAFGLIGLAQAKVLYQYTSHAGFWPLVNAMSAIAATVIGSFTMLLFFRDGPVSVFWLLFGLLYGGLTGTALIVMEKREVAEMAS